CWNWWWGDIRKSRPPARTGRRGNLFRHWSKPLAPGARQPAKALDDTCRAARLTASLAELCAAMDVNGSKRGARAPYPFAARWSVADRSGQWGRGHPGVEPGLAVVQSRASEQPAAPLWPRWPHLHGCRRGRFRPDAW